MIDIRESVMLKKIQETVTHLKSVAADHAERLMDLNGENEILREENAKLRKVFAAAKDCIAVIPADIEALADAIADLEAG